MKRISRSPDETRALAAGFAETLRGGEILALQGDLGVGKTCFVSGLVAALGSSDSVGSPTFGLVREYTGGRLPVAHFDFYRLKSERELWELGWDDYLDGESVLVVEWPDLFPNALPVSARWLRFAEQGENEREIEIPCP